MSETSLKNKANNSNYANAPLIPVRTLIKEGKKGELAAGTYEGKKDGKFGPEYHVRAADGTLYVFPNSQSVREQLDGALNGIKVRAVYNGTVKTKSGKTFHDYEFFVTE